MGLRERLWKLRSGAVPLFDPVQIRRYRRNKMAPVRIYADRAISCADACEPAEKLANHSNEFDEPLSLLHRSTIISVPTQIMLVIIEEPPWLMKGSGMPTTGAMPVTIIKLIIT